MQPRVHYPAYEVGSDMVSADVVSSDDPAEWPESTRLIWLNSPGNPDGVVHGVEFLRAAVARARQLGAVIVQDECYAELGWAEAFDAGTTTSIVSDEVTDGDLTGVLAIYSLSKQSNLAGYRAGLAAGDEQLIQALINVRKQAGLSLPAPIQAAMAAALTDDAHVREQKARYRARRELLLPAAKAWGLRIEHSEAGLYLWGTRGEDAWETMRALAELGIVAGPGHFYGAAAERFVRLSLTASDADIRRAADRLTAAS